MRKSHRTFTVTRHQKDNKSKATSALFLVKIIAKLERTQSNAYQKKRPTQNPRRQWIVKILYLFASFSVIHSIKLIPKRPLNKTFNFWKRKPIILPEACDVRVYRACWNKRPYSQLSLTLELDSYSRKYGWSLGRVGLTRG